MTLPPINIPAKVQPNLQVFRGVFQLWAKPRLPPDVTSAAPVALKPSGSGGNALVVTDQSTASSNTTNLAGLEPGDGFLRSWLGLCRSGQCSVTFSLVRSFNVIMVADVLMEHIAQSMVADEPHGESLHVIAKEKAILRPDAGEMGLRIVQQMQQKCPQLSANVRVCPLWEVIGQTAIAA